MQLERSDLLVSRSVGLRSTASSHLSDVHFAEICKLSIHNLFVICMIEITFTRNTRAEISAVSDPYGKLIPIRMQVFNTKILSNFRLPDDQFATSDSALPHNLPLPALYSSIIG